MDLTYINFVNSGTSETTGIPAYIEGCLAEREHSYLVGEWWDSPTLIKNLYVFVRPREEMRLINRWDLCDAEPYWRERLKRIKASWAGGIYRVLKNDIEAHSTFPNTPSGVLAKNIEWRLVTNRYEMTHTAHFTHNYGETLEVPNNYLAFMLRNSEPASLLNRFLSPKYTGKGMFKRPPKYYANV